MRKTRSVTGWRKKTNTNPKSEQQNTKIGCKIYSRLITIETPKQLSGVFIAKLKHMK